MITSPHDNKSWEAMDEMIGNAEEFCQVNNVLEKSRNSIIVRYVAKYVYSY